MRTIKTRKTFFQRVVRKVRRDFAQLVWRTWGHPFVRRRGRVVARLRGNIKGGILSLNEHFGCWTESPTFLEIGDEGLIEIEGVARFYGGNIIRVEPQAVLKIGNDTHINTETNLNVYQQIEIGAGCYIAQGVHIRDNDGHTLNGRFGVAPVRIGNHVWIGYRATILKGVTIGDHAVIAACSLVVHDVPPRTLVGGSPAKILRTEVHWEP